MSDTRISLRRGEHAKIPSRRELPFRYVDRLGNGLSAVVDLVEHEGTGQRFAHKAFHRYWGREPDKYKQSFQNEIDIIKRLSSNPHIIKVYWSYDCGNELGMLLAPVANQGDLRAYLGSIKDSGERPSWQETGTLYRALGCLASGLAFIHSHTIRHKDVKPQNILVHEGRVVFADFGIAFDASMSDATTTTGRPEAFTVRYCAPEVANHEGRNRKSDVFSLGCVYLDILAVLDPGGFLESFAYDAYWQVVIPIRNRLAQAQSSGCRFANDHDVCHTMLEAVCFSMLEPDNSRRVGVQDVVDLLGAVEDYLLSQALVCDDCIISMQSNIPLVALNPSWDCRTNHQPVGVPEVVKQPSLAEHPVVRAWKLPPEAVRRLMDWLKENPSDLYPDSEEKKKLAKECGMTEEQVARATASARALSNLRAATSNSQLPRIHTLRTIMKGTPRRAVS